MSATTVIGYAYRAALYCPGCVVGALPTGPGEAYDGWALAPGVRMGTEANLDEIAHAFGIDRHDEHTYDSDDFPKVVFASDEISDDACEACGGELL